MGKKNKKGGKLCKIMNYMKSVVQQHQFMPFSKHKEKLLNNLSCLLRLSDIYQNPDKEIFLRFIPNEMLNSLPKNNDMTSNNQNQYNFIDF